MTLTLIHGRACMSQDELDLLHRTVAAAGGDYAEVGSLWGGTAIAAAFATDGQIVCIDPFSHDDEGAQPSVETFWDNIREYDLQDRVELYVCQSAPWPLPADRRFGCVLIDGNHAAPWPETDWESARRVTDVILLHDVNWHEPAVARLHKRVTGDDIGWAEGSTWRVRDQAKFLYAYERVA